MKTIPHNYVWSKRGLPLRSVLVEWVNVIDELAKRWQKDRDVPWWYNERADLSTLAAGIWRSGGHALEEFSTEKRKIGETTGRLFGNYTGRLDMYFETAGGANFYVECKSCWSGIGQPGVKQVNRIRKLLEVARQDVKKFHPHGGGRRLGVVFAKPYLDNSSKVDLRERVAAWLRLWDKRYFDAMAWAFPLACKCGIGTEARAPGVAVFIKELKK